MSPIGISKLVLTSGGGSTLQAEWNYEDNDAFPTYNTGTTVNLVIATGVESYRLTNSLLGQLSLSVNGSNELVLSGTLAQFGFAQQVNEGNSYTLRASDFGVTREFVITVNGELEHLLTDRLVILLSLSSMNRMVHLTQLGKV